MPFSTPASYSKVQRIITVVLRQKTLKCTKNKTRVQRGSSKELRKCLAKKRRVWCKLQTNRADTLIRAKYRQCVSHWRFLVKQRQMKEEERLIECNNIGSFYKFVNRRIRNSNSIGTITDQDGNTITDDYKKSMCI